MRRLRSRLLRRQQVFKDSLNSETMEETLDTAYVKVQIALLKDSRLNEQVRTARFNPRLKARLTKVYVLPYDHLQKMWVFYQERVEPVPLDNYRIVAERFKRRLLGANRHV